MLGLYQRLMGFLLTWRIWTQRFQQSGSSVLNQQPTFYSFSVTFYPSLFADIPKKKITKSHLTTETPCWPLEQCYSRVIAGVSVPPGRWFEMQLPVPASYLLSPDPRTWGPGSWGSPSPPRDPSGASIWEQCLRRQNQKLTRSSLARKV